MRRRWFNGAYLFAAATLLAAAPLAVAQDDARGADRPQRRGRGPDDDRQRGPRGGPHGPRGEQGLEAIGKLVPPREDDRKPLAEGEADELLKFAEEHLPMLAQRLTQLKEHNADVFAARMQDAAPRLRHLRRIYEYDEKLGSNVTKHILNNMLVMERRRWWDRIERPAARERLRAAMRASIAENVQIEVEVLRMYLEQLATRRDELIDRDVAAMTSGDFDKEHGPPELRRLLDEYGKAEGDEAQATVRTRIRAMVAEHYKNDEEDSRRRLDHMETDPAAVVDRRLEMVLNAPPFERPGRGHGPHRERRGRSDEDGEQDEGDARLAPFGTPYFT